MTSKYRAIPTEVDGIRFASKMEARRYGELKLELAYGDVANLKLQPRFPLRVNGVLICTYVADFEYDNLRTGRHIVEDVKGARTAVFVRNKRLMKAIYDIDVLETKA